MQLLHVKMVALCSTFEFCRWFLNFWKTFRLRTTIKYNQAEDVGTLHTKPAWFPRFYQSIICAPWSRFLFFKVKQKFQKYQQISQSCEISTPKAIDDKHKTIDPLNKYFIRFTFLLKHSAAIVILQYYFCVYLS